MYFAGNIKDNIILNNDESVTPIWYDLNITQHEVYKIICLLSF